MRKVVVWSIYFICLISIFSAWNRSDVGDEELYENLVREDMRYVEVDNDVT